MVSEYLLVGGDARQAALAGLLARAHTVKTLGVPGLPDGDGPARELILPIPSAAPDGSPRGLSWDALRSRRPTLRRVLGGALRPLQARLDALGIPAIDLLDDPQTVAENARLTAEAALLLVRQQTGKSLFGQRCAVVGFGRIGQCLCQQLRASGCAVTLLSETPEKRALAQALGIPALPPEEAPAANAAILFNTAPKQLVPDTALAALSPGLLWVELASGPGGLPQTPPFAVLSAPGLPGSPPFAVLPAPGLPGRLLPVSAAEVLYRGILRIPPAPASLSF